MRGLGCKTVVITGGETGIDRAIALRCVAEGALVAVAGIQKDKLDEVAALAEAAPSAGRIITVQADVRERDQIEEMFEAEITEFGRLDAAIANAATFNPATPLIDTQMEDWHRIIAVNLTGAFESLQAAARILMSQGDGGSLLATTSAAVGRPSVGMLPYIASKGGLDVLMRALAIELAPYKIRCNTIMPGFARTSVLDMYSEEYIERALARLPMQELVEPEELAGLVAFAISDEAPHMTGTVLKVDAGRIAG